MEAIKDIIVSPATESQYIRPFQLRFIQGCRERTWDVIKSHDSVSAVLYHQDRNSLVFVKQFRPAVYVNSISIPPGYCGRIDEVANPASLGVTFELCAGIVDKDLPLNRIMQEEILEECGYLVPVERLEKITSCRSGVGFAGALQTYFYSAINERMKVSAGGGNCDECEFIEVVDVPVNMAESFLFDEKVNKPPGILFGVMWFLKCKLPLLKPAQLDSDHRQLNA